MNMPDELSPGTFSELDCDNYDFTRFPAESERHKLRRGPADAAALGRYLNLVDQQQKTAPRQTTTPSECGPEKTVCPVLYHEFLTRPAGFTG
jgi:hypothetical protein